MKYGMEPLGKINESFGGILGNKRTFFSVFNKNLIYWMIVHFNMSYVLQ